MKGVLYTIRDRLARRPDSEHYQSAIRIVIAFLIMAYLWAIGRWEQGPNYLAATWWVLAGEVVLSLALLAAMVLRPGVSHVRRCIGMLGDYASVVLLMLGTGDIGVMFYVVCLWVTIGNGLRYGSKYLLIATAMGAAGLLVVGAISPYWRDNLNLVGGLLLGQIAIPLYFRSLLNALTRALGEARHANEAKSRFLANMSHEFRTPLNGLSGTAELLAVTRLDTEQREYLNTIQASAQSLRSLVDEVLDISAIEAGKLRVRRSVFALDELVNAVGLILRPQAADKGVDLRLEASMEVPTQLLGDPGHLRQVLLNLVGNAIKFTEEGSVELRISIVGRHGDGKVELGFEIADTGIGVPSGMQARVFDAFQQADTGLSRQYEGSGLGTTIAKGLVESMGGRIGFKENHPRGSVFWFVIPFEVESGVDGQQPLPSYGEKSTQPSNVIAFSNPFLRHRARVRAMRILVADDHEANRMVLQRMLEKAGHKAQCVSSGEAALDELVASDFDAVIVDLHMPGMSGLDMLKQLRVMQASGMVHVPVIVLSADVTVESIRRCEEAGARAFLGKPVEADRLLNVLMDIATSKAPVPARARSDGHRMDVERVLDSHILDELAELGMGEDFESQFIGQCLADASHCVDELALAASRGEAEKAREQVHALRGVAANLGLARLAAAAQEFMSKTYPHLPGDWRSRVAVLRDELAEGRKALDARRKKSRRDDGERSPGA